MEEHVNGVPQAESETSKSNTQTGGQASLLKIPEPIKKLTLEQLNNSPSTGR